MKTLLTIMTLVFTMMFSSISFAEWKWVSEGQDGRTYYVDFERIRKVDGYVYWWELGDYLKPNKNGILSAKVYNQGDCRLFRMKRLSFSFYKEPMGGGTAQSASPKNQEWIYPSPRSVGEGILNQVCSW
jgi:hypothetical protein